MRSRFWLMVELMLEDVLELIFEWLLTLEVSQNQATQFFFLFIVPLKHLLPRIVDQAKWQSTSNLPWRKPLDLLDELSWVLGASLRYWVISWHPATVIDSQRYHEEGNLPATSLWLSCWDCYGGTEHLSVLQRSSSQTRRYLWVIFCSSRWTSKESAGLKIYVLAISQDLLKSINKLPLSVNWSYLCCKTRNVDLAC